MAMSEYKDIIETLEAADRYMILQKIMHQVSELASIL
jgi:hypothetical protein